MELLLIPGLMCDETLWEAQVMALSGEASITIPDHKGYDDMATLATKILAKAPDRFALAGLSMGGYISLEIMKQAPDRVEKLALLDTAPYADKPEQSEMRRERMSKAKETGLRAVTEEMLPLLIHPSRMSDKALISAIEKMDESYSLGTYFNQQEAIMSRGNRVPNLSDISCPTLVLCGRQDMLTPLSAHEEMADKIPDSTLVVLEECGHMSTMERPEEVNEAMLNWLRA